jgi:integral membrane sensor domain MASE1
MTNLITRRWLRVALIIIGVAVGYFVTGRFLMVLGAPPNGAVTTVWLPSGISVAALILFGPVAAIGAFIGSLALELKNGTPWAAGLVVGLANAGSELLCYSLIVGRSGRLFSLLNTGNILRFVLAASLGAAVSAFIGVSTYVIAGIVPAAIYWPTWLTWFGSMVIGIVLITPFLVSSTRDWPFPGNRQRYLEYVAALSALSVAAFLWQGPAFSRNTDEPVILVVILVFLWIAFRFPPAAMTLAVFLFTIAAVGGAVLRLRHIPPDTAFYSIFALQMMLGGLAAIGYLLDSLVTAQKRAAEALQADIGRRELAEEEVNRLNAELEHKVEERTSQLLAAQTELDTARARYFSLYDLAPVGYCTVSAEGLILEANHTAESLLGVGRGELVMQPISRFIAEEDRDTSRSALRGKAGEFGAIRRTSGT